MIQFPNLVQIEILDLVQIHFQKECLFWSTLYLFFAKYSMAMFLFFFKGHLLDQFLQPLIDAFPISLPTEIVLHIWKFCQPDLTLPLAFIDRKEARKFLLLIKTTVLSAYNLSIKGAV